MANQRKQGKSHLGGWINEGLKNSVLDIARARKVSPAVVIEEMCEVYLNAAQANAKPSPKVSRSVADATARLKAAQAVRLSK